MSDRTVPALVQVIATTPDGTRAALESAVPLARGSGARLMLIGPRIVPYAWPVDELPDAAEFYGRRYRDIVANAGGDASIQVCVCRRIEEVVSAVVSPSATVVVGGSVGRWWPSPEQRFASRLAHVVRVVYVSSGSPAGVHLPMPAAAVLALGASISGWLAR